MASKVVLVAVAMSITMLAGTFIVIRQELAPPASFREEANDLVDHVKGQRNGRREDQQVEDTVNARAYVSTEGTDSRRRGGSRK